MSTAHPRVASSRDLTMMVLELESLPDVINDLDIDFSADPKAAAAYANDQRNKRKVKEHSDQLHVNIIHPLREGKRLLVLDIDYSMSLSHASGPQSLIRRSYSRHETANVRVATSPGMRPATTPRVPRGCISILRYLHLVRLRNRAGYQSVIVLISENDRSQTSWIWLETKLVELGMLGGSHNYQVFKCLENYKRSPLTKTYFLDLLRYDDVFISAGRR